MLKLTRSDATLPLWEILLSEDGTALAWAWAREGDWSPAPVGLSMVERSLGLWEFMGHGKPLVGDSSGTPMGTFRFESVPWGA